MAREWLDAVGRESLLDDMQYRRLHAVHLRIGRRPGAVYEQEIPEHGNQQTDEK
jgi:hypothetical protein